EAGSPQTLNLFSTTLKKEPNDFGLFCIEGLGNIGSPEAAQIIGTELKNPEWFIRKRLVVALGRCNCPGAVPFLIDALADESVQVRASAIEGLSQVGCHDIPLMIRELEKTSSRERRIGLIRALGTMKDRAVLAPLIKTLADRTTLFVSLDVLGDLGFPEAAESLIPFLRDSEWFNRLNAIEALGKLPLPHLKQMVEPCREDANDMVRHAVARILSRSEEHPAA
ncbi:MAG TPA: HEAT repeat domain-containing protein, partial [Candidatus Ozemobacteraceae bacterium]|nr:HEAT repeat domain-containing protein [Candidatus Ozemobacteraceae bacterium]